MWLVAGDLVQLANERISRGEFRPIPYSQRWGADRTGLDPGVVRRALKRLEAAGVIVNEGLMVRDPANPYERAVAPTKWSFRVHRRGENRVPIP